MTNSTTEASGLNRAAPIAYHRCSPVSSTRSGRTRQHSSSKAKAAISNEIRCFFWLSRFFSSSHSLRICIYNRSTVGYWLEGSRSGDEVRYRRVQRAFGTLLVLEHQVQIASRGQQFLRSRHDARDILRRVLGLAKAIIDEVRRDYRRHFEFLRFRHTQRHVALPERVVHFLHQPACMAEFESVAQVAGQQLQVAAQQRDIALHRRRQLEQNRSQAPRTA